MVKLSDARLTYLADGQWYSLPSTEPRQDILSLAAEVRVLRRLVRALDEAGRLAVDHKDPMGAAQQCQAVREAIREWEKL